MSKNAGEFFRRRGGSGVWRAPALRRIEGELRRRRGEGAESLSPEITDLRWDMIRRLATPPFQRRDSGMIELARHIERCVPPWGDSPLRIELDRVGVWKISICIVDEIILSLAYYPAALTPGKPPLFVADITDLAYKAFDDERNSERPKALERIEDPWIGFEFRPRRPKKGMEIVFFFESALCRRLSKAGFPMQGSIELLSKDDRRYYERKGIWIDPADSGNLHGSIQRWRPRLRNSA